MEQRFLLAADVFEDNDTFGTATDLTATPGSRTINNLNIEPAGDDDYFRWKAASSGGVVIDLLFNHSQGDIDLEVLNSVGGVLGTSTGTKNQERVAINVVQGQEYVIHAFPAFTLGVNANYTLQISEIPNDPKEPNNSTFFATDLGSTPQTINNLSLHSPTDEDFFKFTAPAVGILHVDASFIHANGNVDIALLDANGGEITRSDGSTNLEHVDHDLIAGQVVYLRVYSQNHETQTAYNLSLNFGQSPVLAEIPDQIAFIGGSAPFEVPINVTDGDTPTSALLFSATSDNPSFIATGAMRFDTSGPVPKLLLPANSTGFVPNITVTVSDGQGGSASTTFRYTVFSSGPLNLLPTISNIGNAVVNEDTFSGNIPFTVGDPLGDPNTVVVTATSSNQALIPNSSIMLGGSGANRTLGFTPAANLSGGPVTITVKVTDQGGLTAMDTFDVTVNAVADPPGLIVSNANGTEDTAIPLSISASSVDADGSEALAIQISGVPVGAKLSAGVNLGGGVWMLSAAQTAGLTITPPRDNDSAFMLNVQAISTESSNGNTASGAILPLFVTVNSVNDAPTISNIINQITPANTPTAAIPFIVGDAETFAGSLFVTGDSSNDALVPDSNVVIGGSGANRTVTVTPNLASVGSTTITISVFDGATTTQRQFVVTVDGGNTAPTISAVADTSVNENTPTAAIPFTVGDGQTAAGSLTVTGISSNPALVPNGNIVIGGSGSSRTVTVTPIANQIGTVTISLVVDDGQGGQALETFDLTVNDDPNDAPTITTVGNITTAEDTPTTAISVAVADEETAAGSLVLTASSSNPTLVPNANIKIGPSPAGGSNRFVVITPAADQSGSATITLTVTDGGGKTATTTFTVNVTPVADAPAISPISPITMNENSTFGPVPFTITDADSAVGGLTVTASSANQGLFKNSNLVIGGSGGNRTLTLTPEANQIGGPLPITITVSDGVTTTTTTVMVTVLNVDNPPNIVNASVTIPENSGNGLNVYDVNDATTGGEVDSDGDVITYSIIGGNTGGAFAINATTGQITVANSAALNFETTPTFNLTVRGNSGSQSDTGIVTINLSNVNEGPSVNPGQVFAVAEGSGSGTVVGTVTITDPDVGQGHTYAITAGNSSGAFSINSAGQIVVANAAALIPGASFTLTIQTTDSGTPGLVGSGNVTVNVLEVNDPPVVSSPTFTLPENSANGSVVGTVGVTDPDLSQTHTWSIIGGNTGGAFAINTATGQISVANAAALDFETTPSFSLTVQSTDNGAPPLSGTGTVTINLTNANEAPIVSSASFSLPENSVANTLVGIVTAIDPDAGQTRTWSITGGNTGGAFAINASTGQISVANAAALNFETTPTFSLTVQATDNGSPAQSGSAPITINLTNVNEAPTVLNPTFSIQENSPIATVVGTVGVTDPDVGQTFTWSITGGNTGGAFTINATTGQISVANPAALNFETSPSFSLTVQATDSGSPALSGSNTVTVNLTNVNESPAVNGTTFSLAENSANGTAVGTVTATDPDAGSTQTWAITSGNAGGAFAINAATGQITVANSAALNFETSPAFALTVQATDNGTPAISATGTVLINLTNVNEAPTVNTATFTISEDSPNATVVGTATATDPEPGQTQTWSIVGGNTGGAFAINATTGVITVANSAALDFESSPTFTLNVQATDNGSPAMSGGNTITINLTNVNDVPVINPGQVFSVGEFAGNATVVGTVAITDPDPGQTHFYSFASGNIGAAFSINPTTGTISVNNSALLDPNVNPTFTLAVQVTDSGTPNLSGLGNVTVNVSAINHAPAVGSPTFSLAENSANGTTVGTVTATDADAGQTLAWSITGGNTGGAFAINAATGQITVANAAALNFEATPSFSLTVRATDNGSPVMFGNGTVTINLTNVNEAPVVTGATFSLAENTANGTAVGTIAATDPDAGQTLSWAITGGNASGAFAINAATGQITVANSAALNFEATPSFSLTVQATDNGTPVLSGSATVTINLTNVNEAPLVANPTFTLTENSPVGTVVGNVMTMDPDSGQTLALAITAGNTGGAFAISANGDITVANAAAINFEANPTFSLTVQATDNGSPALSASNTVTINLTNVNEAPVVASPTFSLAENSANATVVGTVGVTEQDAGQTLTWAITGGNGLGAFAINAATGQITVANSSVLNFEVNPSFSLTVQATDNGSPALSGSGTVTINLTNVNEAPVVVNPTFTIAENSANATVVGTVALTDPDAGQTHTWSITGGNTGGAFAINAATGQITVANSAALNFETSPSFSLTVQATDNGTPALSGSNTVTVNLTNVNEAPAVNAGQVFSLAENSANATVVGTVAITDPDVGQPHTFAITAGNTSGAFAINAATGQITVANSAALNFEVTPSFALTVQVTDNGTPALNGSATVTVNLTNVPETVDGDYDSDGDVDSADLNVWRGQMGQVGNNLAADGDHDGDVDGNDMMVWQRNLGRTVAVAASTAEEAPAVTAGSESEAPAPVAAAAAESSAPATVESAPAASSDAPAGSGQFFVTMNSGDGSSSGGSSSRGNAAAAKNHAARHAHLGPQGSSSRRPASTSPTSSSSASPTQAAHGEACDDFAAAADEYFADANSTLGRSMF